MPSQFGELIQQSQVGFDFGTNARFLDFQHHFLAATGKTAVHLTDGSDADGLGIDTGKGGFQGELTTRKYVAMANVSRATAFREISDLVEKGLLAQSSGRGRSVRYEVRWRSISI